MSYKFILSALIIIPLFVITGCQRTVNHADNPSSIDVKSAWHLHQQQLKDFQHYQASGKFAYVSQQKTHSANFAWLQHSLNNYQLILTTPFGNKVMELTTSPNASQLIDNNNHVFHDSDAENLIQTLTHMQLPLLNLQQWLIGLPGDSLNYQLDQQGRLRQLSFEKSGEYWQVNYLHYDTSKSPALPDSLRLSTNSLTIKIKINHWET